MLTADHIRYATNRQLAELFDINENTVSRWTNQKQGISGLMLQRAAEKGLDKSLVISGLDARKDDAELIRQHQEELDRFLTTTAQPVVA